MLGKTEGEREGMTEDEMAGWHHLLSGHEFKQTPGDSEGRESLVCSPWGLIRDGHNSVTEQKQFSQVDYLYIFYLALLLGI